MAENDSSESRLACPQTLTIMLVRGASLAWLLAMAASGSLRVSHHNSAGLPTDAARPVGCGGGKVGSRYVNGFCASNR